MLTDVIEAIAGGTYRIGCAEPQALQDGRWLVPGLVYVDETIQKLRTLLGAMQLSWPVELFGGPHHCRRCRRVFASGDAHQCDGSGNLWVRQRSLGKLGRGH